MSYAVAQRSREIGIRMAIGAHPTDVMRLMFRNAGALIASGIVVGLVGSLALSRSLSSLLFNLSPTRSLLPGWRACYARWLSLPATFPPEKRRTSIRCSH